MAVSCSLGPADVLVQDITTDALTLDRAVQGLSPDERASVGLSRDLPPG